MASTTHLTSSSAACSAQAVGLQMTSATRAGFLVQLTAVITPVLAYLAGDRVSPRVWMAALLALSGTCLIALDGVQDAAAGAADAAAPLVAVGDLYLLSACFFYSMATMRLGLYAPRHSPVDLAAGEALGEWAASCAEQQVDLALGEVLLLPGEGGGQGAGCSRGVQQEGCVRAAQLCSH